MPRSIRPVAALLFFSAFTSSFLFASSALSAQTIVATTSLQTAQQSSARNTSSPSPQQISGTLRWGGDAEGGAPFVEADPSNPSVVRGFDVEIAGMIARGLHRNAQFVQVGWSSIEASVERGDFDIGMSGVEDRPALRARHAVTTPYYRFHEVLAVRPGDSLHYRTLADLAGKRVATLGGTMAYELLLDASHRNALVPISYDDDVHPYADLVAGRVDAVLLDNIIAERSLRRTGGFIIVSPPIATGYYVGVMAHDNAALRDSVDVIITGLMRDGSLEATFRRWNVWDASEAEYFHEMVARSDASTAGAANAASASGATGANGAGTASADRTQRLIDSALASRAMPSAASRALAVYLPALLRAAVITLILSFLAMALAVSAGVCIAAGRVYGNALVRGILTVYVEVMRGTPVLLQLFVIYYGISGFIRLPAFAAAVLGLGLNYAAYEAEIYRAALQSISTLQLEAARTLGLSEFQTLRFVRGPQALRLALAPMTNDFVSLLKDTSLVSVITVVELTKQTAIYAANVGSWLLPGILCAIIYLVFSLPLSHYARRLEQRWNHA